MSIKLSTSIGFISNITIILLISLSVISCKDNSPKQNEVESDSELETKADDSSTKKDKKVILCFGNSLTAGYGLDDETTWWTSLLQERIDSMGYNYTVVNAGLSGETTSGGLQRISWALNQQVDIFILELGANDMLRGLAVDNTRENLEKIIISVREKNKDISVIVAGMMAPPNMGKDYENAFNNIYPFLTKKYDATLIPFFLDGVALDADLNLPDGKHPNAKGQKIVLENVWKAIESQL